MRALCATSHHQPGHLVLARPLERMVRVIDPAEAFQREPEIPPGARVVTVLVHEALKLDERCLGLPGL